MGSSDGYDQSTWISINEILSFFKGTEIFHFCLISDNCYSGAIFKENERGGGIESLLNRKSRYALTSGGIEKVKDGKIGDSSPFNKVLCDVLFKNNLKAVSFEIIANDVVLNFPKNIKQTPRSGILNGLGHEGGAFILTLKDDLNDLSITFKEISLPLNFSNKIKINYDCRIPLFENNDKFDSNLINVSIQNIVYELLIDLRNVLINAEIELDEIPQVSEYFYEIGYTVNLISSKFISINISTFSHLGGPYPRSEVISINYILSPERKIGLNDLIRISNATEFFNMIIRKYSEDGEERETLLEYLDYYSLSGIEFSITDENINISFLNYIPKVVQCYAFLSFPLIDFNIDVGQIYYIE